MIMFSHSMRFIFALLFVLNGLGCEDGEQSSGADEPDSMRPGQSGDAHFSRPTVPDRGQVSELDQSAPEDSTRALSDLSAPRPLDPDAAPVSDATPPPVYNGPRKKGIAMHQRTYDWSEKVAAVQPFWSYSWGLRRSQFQPDGVEFVPMQWSGSLSDEDAEYLRTQFAAGEVQYLLGYNEPDGERQANMSVDRALELWPQLEALGIPLVSPSPVHYDNEWMLEFMRRADENGLRIDHLAFHWYGGTDAQYFLDLLDQVYERYQLPIWITEFAPADWNAERREDNRMRAEWVLEFMRTVLPELDRREYIVRYAWFHDYSSAQLWTSALFDDEGVLTPLGEFYAQHSANPEAGPGKPYPLPQADPGNLLRNGDFDLGDSGDWGGYERHFPSIDATESHEGAFCARLRGGFSSAIDQNLTLEAGRRYRVTLHTRWSQAPRRPISAVLERSGGEDRVSGPSFDATDWQETSFLYTPTESAEHTFWIWTGPDEPAHLYVDTVSIRLEE